MGEITKDEAIKQLTELNPRMSRDRVIIYVDSFFMYREACANIEKNGALVAHPRTGAPIDNPYLKVRKMASDVIMKTRLNVGNIWGERG
jgi:hypothetical protein